jgi:hypothetical protein
MSTASNTIKTNKINNTKNTKNINDLKKQVEKLTEESKKQREFILYLYSVIFGNDNGKTKLNKSLLYHNNTTFHSLIDEVQALSTAMAEIVYNNPQNYYNNTRGPRSGYSPENPGYMSKIKKRGELKKSTSSNK